MAKDWIDAHSHLADPRLISSVEGVIDRARKAGINAFLQGGVDPADWKRQLELRARFGEGILPVFGAYPVWVASASDHEVDASLRKLEQALPAARAVGEIGLDFRGPHNADARKRQFHAFETQLALAKTKGLAIVLHVVHAHPEALRLLKKAGHGSGGIVHSFTGTLAHARNYLDLGYAISFGCGILRNTAAQLREAVRDIPPDFLVIESDAPDQGPPRSQTLNEPTSILLTASEIAKLRSTTPEEVLDRSTASLRKIFNVPERS